MNTSERVIQMTKSKAYYKFSEWLFRGRGKKAGWRTIVNRSSIIDLFIGTMLAIYVPLTPSKAAEVVILPIVAILIGVSFAWIGNAHVILQSKAIRLLAKEYGGGIPEYLHCYQLTVLIVLATLTLWGFAGLELFEVWNNIVFCEIFVYSNVIIVSALTAAKILLYSMLSKMMRETWSIIGFTQGLAQAQIGINELIEDKKEKSSEESKRKRKK